jgi:hypothetical protein
MAARSGARTGGTTAVELTRSSGLRGAEVNLSNIVCTTTKYANDVSSVNWGRA